MSSTALAGAAARTVYIVEDDDAMRDALAMLLRTAGFTVEKFASALEFLNGYGAKGPACLVLDVRMPRMSGLELQDQLAARGIRLPIIFISGHGDIPMAVEAVKKGAYDFIEKPFDDYQLLCQVLNALDQGAVEARDDASGTGGAERLALLTEREREVLDLVLAGKPSRQVAEELYISAKTVEFHRARIMQKLNVRSAAELFRVCLAGSQV